ncbi:transposase [Candidatus Dependentiae bacterium]|nr:transposase [Candidatus Dependentiae bacterium]
MKDFVYFDFAVTKLRNFFKSRGYIEVHPQSRLSILAACEDPKTIATYNYANTLWPLPQTGQMWLEHDLLRNPEVPGLFCVTTSYRQEPNPIPGRHELIFPMFEFETHGGIEELQKLEEDFIEYLGFGDKQEFKAANYLDVASHFKVKEIDSKCEEKINEELGSVFFLKNFPQYTSPFWNMKKDGDVAKKIDVILFGVETVGSAERSTDREEMRELFHTISNGMYANILYAHFGKERVLKELNEFLSFDFFPRCGGGIGLTRLIRALKMINEDKYYGAVKSRSDMSATRDMF